MVLVSNPGTGLLADDRKPTLCVGNYQSEADAVKQLARFKKSYSNLDEWKSREAKIRRQILVGAGLDPLPSTKKSSQPPGVFTPPCSIKSCASKCERVESSEPTQ